MFSATRCSVPVSLGARRRWFALVLVISTAFLSVGFAQDADDNTASPSAGAQSDTPRYSAEVKVVNLLATVRNKHGQIINNLSKDDFTLEEDGRPQTIKYFTRESDMPLKLGLLVDTSMSTLKDLPDERSASVSFLDQLVREEKDAAFVIHFDRQVELLQDLTSSKQKLASATDQIEPSSRDDNQSSGGSPTGYPGGARGGHHHFGGGGTLLYDAVFLASDELMQKQKGRKALILLTDGDDRGSKTSLVSAIESAQRADTIVYCIYFKGEDPGNFGGFGRGGHGGWGGLGGMGGPRAGRGGYPQESHEDGKKVLERMAKETGGRMFEISKKQPIDQIYSQIEQELRNQYSLGYTPDHNGTESYHKIHLASKEKNDIVQTRDGYYD
ncbi:MAG TPA: VWA domain-containing protein [Terriglobales bacterium]|nr:VWA domain-containing protein [Terriglobales bacterium]